MIRVFGKRFFFDELWGSRELLSKFAPFASVSTWYLTTCVRFQDTDGSGGEGLEVSQRAKPLPAMGEPEAAALCQDA